MNVINGVGQMFACNKNLIIDVVPMVVRHENVGSYGGLS